MLVDSHCHLDSPAFAGEGLDAVLDRARAAGVGRFLTIGTSQPEFPMVRAVAEKYDDVYFSLAVHPHEAENEGEAITASALAALTDHPKFVAIGETGLDYFYDHAPREAQQRNFREHIRACIATGLPLIIHTRDAEADTIRILQQERQGHEDKLTGVFHCFSSNADMATYGLEIGFYFSISGMVTFPKSQNVRDIVRDIPLDRLMVETDAPYLAPVPFRGKTCEPCHVVATATAVAALKGVSMQEFSAATTANFFRLFTKAR